MTKPDSEVPVRRGDVFWTDWSPGRGSEQTEVRPAVIVQTDSGNRSSRYPNTIVAAITTKYRDVRTHVPVEPTPQNGLSRLSYVKCEQLFTLSKQRLQDKSDSLDPSTMDLVDQTLKQALGLK